MPVFNGAPFIHEAITSVLSQTYENFSLTVIDNCSTDNTVNIVESFSDDRITLVRNDENLGAFRNWEKASRIHDGTYWKLICADDVIYPECLERQVAILDDPKNEKAVFVAARRDVINETGDKVFRGHGLKGMLGLIDGKKALRNIVRLGSNPFGEPAGVLVRSSALIKAGAFRDKGYMIDVDLWVRLLALDDAHVYAMDDTLAAFRISPTSWSNTIGGKQASEARQFLRSLRASHPKNVSRFDEGVGLFMATLSGFGRQLVYAHLARKAKKS